MSEKLEPDLDIVLDFRFTEIEAELFVVLQHLEAVLDSGVCGEYGAGR